MSHPSRMCGLKYIVLSNGLVVERVTSFTDVWIEIVIPAGDYNFTVTSHPSRMCGLKFDEAPVYSHVLESHPSRMCGLKSINGGLLVA